MNKKAIRILIVGGQGTGKTTLAKKIAEIMKNEGHHLRLYDGDAEFQYFRPQYTLVQKTDNTVETYDSGISRATKEGVEAALYINLDKGCIRDFQGYLPDELREPITAAATEQINWVNERFPMRNGRVAFRAECEMSEEDMKKLIETRTCKEDGEVEKSNPVDEGTTAKAFKRLAQELTELAERKKKRRQIRTAIRSILILLTCAFFIVAIIMIARSGIDFLRALLAAITTGLLSSLFDND